MSELLERNLKLISTRDSALADRIRSASGASLPLEHDPTFPGATRFDETETFVLTGLGDHAVDVARRLDATCWLAVIEADGSAARSAFERIDLSPLLLRERVRLFVGPDLDLLTGWLKAFLDAAEATDITFLPYRPALKSFPDRYARIDGVVRAAINRRQVELRTLIEHAELLETNVISNLPWIVRSAGIKSFEGAARGCPAVVVGAGPSLTGDLEGLQVCAGKAIIITVGKALRLLLNRGIVPQFVASLDMLAVSQACYEGFEIPPEIALLWDPDSTPEIVSAFPGDRITYDTTTPLVRWGKSFWGSKGEMAKGLSVAHTAFLFARHLGADPIVLGGVDLALPGERTHAEGVTMTWGGAVDPDNPHLIEIPSVTGGRVRSTQAFLSFVTSFEEEIARTSAKVIHTSPAGALIRGAVASAFPRDLMGTVPTFREALDAPRPFDRRSFETASARVLETAQRVMDRAEAGLRALRRASKFDRTNKLDEAEFQKVAVRINALRRENEQELEFKPLVERVLSRHALEMRELTKQFNRSKDIREGTKLDIRRQESYFQGYARAARFLVDHLEPVRAFLLK